VSALWLGILLACAGCYALKLAGLSVPEHLLERPAVRRAVGLIPVALLGALLAVQVLADGRGLDVDARVAALGVAAVLLLLRVPFLPMVLAAALTAALLRAVG
jgi:uncharacterized membrane protein